MSSVFESLQEGMYDDYDTALYPALETASTDAAVLEMLSTTSKIDRAYQSFDLTTSMSYILEGTSNRNAIMEGFFSDTVEKIKEGFVKLKNAIIAWFKKVILFFESLFKNGKKFVDAYGDKLKSKSTDGFTYTGYEWDIEKGDKVVSTVTAAIDKDITSRLGASLDSAAGNLDKTNFKMSGDNKDADESSLADTIVSKIKGDFNTLTELKDNIEITYRGGKTTMTTDCKLTSAKVNEYLKFVETGKNTIGDLKTEQKTFENKINAIIGHFNSAKKDLEKEENKHKTEISTLTFASKYFTVLINVRKSAIDKKSTMYKTMLVGVTAVLKKFLRWGGKKESSVLNSSYEDDFDMSLTMESMAAFMEAEDIGGDDIDDDEITESAFDDTDYDNNDIYNSSINESSIFSKFFNSI